MNKIPRRLFSAWMGPAKMSLSRSAALESIVIHCGVPLNFVSYLNIQSWIHPDFPIHRVFPYLSAVHQCDYLRCYLLHVYGGGYTDIKHTQHNWNVFFEKFEASDHQFGAGYTEIGPQGVAQVGGQLQIDMQNNFQKLIGVCSLIVKPDTKFTRLWFDSVNLTLDLHQDSIIQNPARHPQDHYGALFEGGENSNYPLNWTGLGGDLLHPLIYEYSSDFLHLKMAPFFHDYR